MNKLEMRLCGDRVLREVAVPVELEGRDALPPGPAEIKDFGGWVVRPDRTAWQAVPTNILQILDQMVAMMDEQNGVGLAAPQVGISKRFLVMRDIQDPRKSGEKSDAPVLKMINPTITAKSDDLVVLEEGCLSVLGPDGPVFADVERPVAVMIEWIDENGAPHAREFTEIAARIAQHEIDHLDGILFIDYLSSAKREMLMNKVKKRRYSLPVHCNE
jgi:peptide deformylase